MPKKNDKKVILVSGGGSNWYEQAIFIVKDKNSRLPIDIVKEAENIIKKYIADNKLNDIYKSNKLPRPDIKDNVKNNLDKAKSFNKEKNKAYKSKNVSKTASQTNFILNTAIVLCMVLICCLMYLVFKI